MKTDTMKIYSIPLYSLEDSVTTMITEYNDGYYRGYIAKFGKIVYISVSKKTEEILNDLAVFLSE